MMIAQLTGERCRNIRVPDPHPTATVIPHQSQHYRSDCRKIIIQHYTGQIVINIIGQIVIPHQSQHYRSDCHISIKHCITGRIVIYI